MNDKNFDSFIKQSLDGHGSAVPTDMWKRIQAMKDFDPFVKENLNRLDSPIPTDMWDRITTEKDFDTHIRQNVEQISSPVPTDMWSRIQHEKDFDATVKEKLDNHASPVPANMWQRIHPEEKKKPRPIIWWWAAAASLLLLAGIGASLFINRKPSQPTITKNNIAPSANGSQKNNSITTLPNASGNSVSSSRGHDSLTIPNANNPVSKTDLAVPNNPSLANQNTSAVQNTISNKNTGKQNNLIITNPTNTNQVTTDNSNNGNNHFNNLTKTTHKNNQFKNWNKGANNSFPSSSSVVQNGITENTNEQLLLNSNTLSGSEKQLMLKNLIRSSIANNKLMPQQLLRANKKIPSIVCPTLGPPSRNDWYVEAFISPDFVVKNLHDKPSGTNIKTGMDSTLHRQISFSAGVNIVKNIGENFLVKTGVQYSQVNELFKYNSGSDTRTTTVITVRDVIVSPGDTIHIRDTSTVTQTGTLSKQNQNRYKQWDIPLIFGYEFGGEGLRMNANLGVIANIRSSYQGNMLDTAQKVIDIASYNNTGIYKTSIGLGVYLGLGILKPLNDNMDLLVEPHARFNLANMTTQAAIFNQKNSIFGLSVGIRYKLNNGRQRY